MSIVMTRLLFRLIGLFVSIVLIWFGWQYFTTPAANQLVVEEVSNSPLSRFLQPTPTPVPQSIKLLFGGDLMFDRHIRQHMEREGADFVLAPLAKTFGQYDAVVANLEGPVTDSPSRSVNSAVGSTNNFIFTFDPDIVPMLKKYNLTIVNLGNNHILNFGTDGVRQTKTYLTEGGIEFFGNTTLENRVSDRVLFKTFSELTLAFVNYNQFVDAGWETALEDVAFADPLADLVIVMPHWGNEYETMANQTVRNWAYQLIDVGADLIIGGHPHVTQQREIYQGKTIYYSLGNFVFDQYFQPEVQQGLLIGVEIAPDLSLSFAEYPIQLSPNGQTSLVP